jgi:long-chain fatty acid transport protein
MNNLLKFLLAVSLLGLNTCRIFANGFSILNQDAFATARGQAFVATADNPSAIYYNPAGIAQLEGDNLRGGACGFDLNTAFSPLDTAPNAGSTYHDAYHYAAVPQGFYTHTFEKWPLSFGLGVYAPFGGDIDWPQDTGFRTVATEGRLLYLSVNPVLALKLSPNFSLAAGASVNYVNLDLEQGILAGNFFPNFFQFKGDGWSAGYNLGALWQPIKQLSFGATFRSSATVNLQGQTKTEEIPAFTQVTTPANLPLTFPLSGVVGASYRPTPKWNLEFDADYTGWGSFGETSIQQAQQPNFAVVQNVPVNLDWQSSWTIELGVTRYFDHGLHVSAGYAYDENSVPDQYYTPFAADMDRHFFSIGAGFKGKTLNFDLTYQFGYGPTHTVVGSQPSSSASTLASNQTGDGKYSFNSSALMVSAGIHF